MERNQETLGLLDLMTRPGFCVNDRIITKANSAAQALLLSPGTEITSLLHTGREEYAAFHRGCLFLTLSLGGEILEATVTNSPQGHIFLLEQRSDNHALQALSLAARELRDPLTSMLLSVRQLNPWDDESREQLARLNRGLYQLQRMLGNMSDAGCIPAAHRQEMTNITRLMAEIFDKAQLLVQDSGCHLQYTGLNQDIFVLADRELLERAVLNLLSNALKFLPENGSIVVRLSRKGRLLCLQIRDNGPGIPESLQGSLFRRYLRQPGIEDGRFGLGLGLVLVRTAAAAHQGTVLIDQPRGGGTRVTMTIAIRESSTLHSPVMHIDYAGEQDHTLMELSDILPLHYYEKN